MLATIGNRSGPFRHKLLVGAVATLSRNFQLHFLRDMIADKEVEVIIRSGSLGELLEKLEAHQLDLVLTNTAVHGHANSRLRIQLVDKQAVNLLRHP